MTRHSTSRDRLGGPTSPSIVKAVGQQGREDRGRQRSKPYSRALLAIWESRIADGEVPTGSQLAQLLSANGGRALPPWLLDHLCCHLRGEVRRKPGPKTLSAQEELEIAAALQPYGKLLAWLQKRKRSQGLNGWSCIRKADWWRGPPHERAKRMIQERSPILRRFDLHRLANIISSRNQVPRLRE